MVWQEDIKQIVMLTNLMEGTKVICVLMYSVFETYIKFVLFFFWHFFIRCSFRLLSLYVIVIGEMCAVLARYRPKYSH